MEANKNKSASRRKSSSKTNAGYLIPESEFLKIQSINAQLQLLRQLAQRPDKEEITITAQALEETLARIEDGLSSALEQAEFHTH
jgi:hypothetical protein